MSKPAMSLYVFSIYLFGVSAAFLIVPNLLLGLFGLPATTEVWIRVSGMVVGFLAFYYMQASRSEMTTFIRWTVPVRLSVAVFLLAFVLMKIAPTNILLLGGGDIAGGLWTAFTLRQSSSNPPKH